jgi:glutamate synthase domain-containing protein 2
MMQELTGKPVGIKIVVGTNEAVRDIARHMKETGEAPDFITVDGGEGGTGAAPVDLADRAGHAYPACHPHCGYDLARRRCARYDHVIVASWSNRSW